MPFDSLGEGDEATLYAAGVTEEILTKLSRFKDLAVLGGKSARSLPATADPQSIARELAARYLVTGSLRLSGPEMRVTSRLVDAGTGTVLWAQTYEENLRAKELFAIQEDIAQQVATAVAQPYGVVFRSELQRTADQPPDDLEAYACTLRFYVYRAEPSPESHALVRKCLERAVARFPGYATAWAMLSLLALDEDRFAFNPQARRARSDRAGAAGGASGRRPRRRQRPRPAGLDDGVVLPRRGRRGRRASASWRWPPIRTTASC